MNPKGEDPVPPKGYVYTGEHSVYKRGFLAPSVIQSLVDRHIFHCLNRRELNPNGPNAGAIDCVTNHLDLFFGKTFNLKHDQFKIGNLLGKGAYGKVYEAVHGRLGNIVLKELNCGAMHDTSECFKERDLLVYLEHERVVKFHGSYYFTSPYLVLERCKTALDTNNVNISTFDMVRFTVHLLEGLNFIHSKRIMHCDLKAANLLINQDNNLVICDFGAAVCLPEGKDYYINERIIGHAGYSDYDVLDKYMYTFGNDIYAAGCILFVLSTQKHLMYYPTVESKRIYKDTIINGYMRGYDNNSKATHDVYEREPLNERANKSYLASVIIPMITKDSNTRPSAQYLLDSEELHKLISQHVGKRENINSECRSTFDFHKGDSIKGNQKETSDTEFRTRDLAFVTFYYDPEEEREIDLRFPASVTVFTQENPKKKGKTSQNDTGSGSSSDSSEDLDSDDNDKDVALKNKGTRKVVKETSEDKDEESDGIEVVQSDSESNEYDKRIAICPNPTPPAVNRSGLYVDKFLFDFLLQQPPVKQLYERLKMDDFTWIENANALRELFKSMNLGEKIVLPSETPLAVDTYSPNKSMEDLNKIVFEWDLKMQLWAQKAGKNDKNASSIPVGPEAKVVRFANKNAADTSGNGADCDPEQKKEDVNDIELINEASSDQERYSSKTSKSMKKRTKMEKESPVKISPKTKNSFSKPKRGTKRKLSHQYTTSDDSDNDRAQQSQKIKAKPYDRRKEKPRKEVSAKEDTTKNVTKKPEVTSKGKESGKTIPDPPKKLKCCYCGTVFYDRPACKAHVKVCKHKKSKE